MNKQKDRLGILRDEPVARALIKLGTPTMAGMLISALYNAIDAYFVGGLGLSQMGAVSVVFPIVQVVIGLGMMFGAGASSYISRQLGSGGHAAASQTASTALAASLAVGAAVIVGMLTFLDGVLTGLGATETILPYARAYARIYVTGSILNVFTVTMNNLLTAQGAARFTMLSMLTGSLLNVLLDPVLIYGLGWGIEGAAAATVISLCASAALYIGYIVTKQGVLRLSVRNIRISRRLFAEILKIGIPVLLFQLLSSVSLGATNTAAKPYGDHAVAAMGAVARIMAVGTYIIFGFLKGFQPFAGYHYGAKQFGRLRQAIRLCLLWSTAFAAVAAVALIAFAGPAVALFGNDADMVALAGRALRLNAVMFLSFGFQMVYASLYLSIGNGLAGGLLSLSRQGIFFLPLIGILPALFGIDGLIWVQPAADLFAALLTVVFAVKMNRLLAAESFAEPSSAAAPAEKHID